MHDADGFDRVSAVFAQTRFDGLGIGAVRSGERLLLRIEPPAGKERWEGEIRFDTPRHREIFHLEQNFLRLNELPEWFTVEREANYLLKHAGGKRIEAKGEALAKGMRMTEGDWVVEKAGMGPARQ